MSCLLDRRASVDWSGVRVPTPLSHQRCTWEWEPSRGLSFCSLGYAGNRAVHPFDRKQAIPAYRASPGPNHVEYIPIGGGESHWGDVQRLTRVTQLLDCRRA